MARIFLTEQERRELFAEYIAHYINGEITGADFVEKCTVAGIDADAVSNAHQNYRVENIRNWRYR